MDTTPFICFDTEDNSAELTAQHGDGSKGRKVTQIAAINAKGERYWNPGDSKAFLKWLTLQGPQCFVYAHNLQYDLGNIFDGKLDVLDMTMVSSRLIRARWKNCIFLDSFNIWPMGLKKLGSAFGLEKMAFDAGSKEYVFRDVEILRKAMQFAWQYAADYDIDPLPSTLGGLCVKVWEAMGGEGWPCSDDMAKEAYYGGRVELFSKGGTGRIAYTDINSLYPSVMTGEFPTDWHPLKSLDGWGVARVVIDVPKCFIAPLPMRREDGSIYYPYGRLTGTWTLHEIRNAIRHGAKVVETGEIYGSTTASRPYASFVQRHYEMRRTEKDPAKKLMLKLLMNNLYGRLGTSGEISRTLKLTELDFTESGGYKGGGIPFGTKHLLPVQMPLQSHVNWLHAAYITSYARLALQDYLRKVDQKSLIYCDTDSIIFWCKDELPFPVSDKLGEMKLEGFANRCHVLQPKLYMFGYHIKTKGVPKRRVRSQGRVWNPAVEFFRNGSTEFFLPYKMRESIRFHDCPELKQRKLSVWRKVTKTRQTGYDRKKFVKGIYQPLKHK